MYPCRDLVTRVFTSCMITSINGTIAGKIISVTTKKQRGLKLASNQLTIDVRMRIKKYWWLSLSSKGDFCELCSNNLVSPWRYSLQQNLGEFLWYDKHTTILRAACVIFLVTFDFCKFIYTIIWQNVMYYNCTVSLGGDK